MSVMSARMLAKRAAARDATQVEELAELVEDIVAQLLPQLIVSCLSDPQVIRALRVHLGTAKTAGGSPLRAAEVKAARRKV